jgi:hypothetical protein
MDDPNKRHHIFGNPDHNLDALIGQYGSEEAAGEAIVEAVNQAYRAGILVLDAQGRYRQVVEVGGYPVTVGGRVVIGVARVGSAWIRPSRTENHDDA